MWRARWQGVQSWPGVEPEDVQGPTLVYTGSADGNVVAQLQQQRAAMEAADVGGQGMGAFVLGIARVEDALQGQEPQEGHYNSDFKNVYCVFIILYKVIKLMSSVRFPPQPHEEATVRTLYEQLMDGWNQGSGAAFSAPFAEDGDLIGFDGTHLKGRSEIASFHQSLFKKWLQGTRLVGEVKSVRFLTPEVAVMHAVGGTVMRGKSDPAPERDSIQTLIAIKRGGEWCLAAFQNTRVRPMGRNAGGTLVWLLSDWLWKLCRPRKGVASPLSRP